MKSILYIGAFRFPTHDAAAARVLNNAKILRDIGYNVFFISWGGVTDDPDNVFTYNGFDYICTGELDKKNSNPLNRLKYYYYRGEKTLTILERFADVDIIIGYNPGYWFTKQISNYCAKNGIKYISDVTEWYDSNEFPGGKLLPFYWWNEYNMHILHDKLITNKILISSYLDNYYKYANSIVLPPLIDLSEYKWSYSIDKFDNLSIKNHKGIKIIYAGSPAKKDLLGNIITALLLYLKKSDNIQLLILGVSEEQSMRFISPLDLQKYKKNIVFMGRMPQELIPAYYKISDFSIIVRKPNRKNLAGFPTKLVESFSSSCPVICNPTSDLLKFVRDGYNGIIIDNYNVNNILGGLNRISTTPLDHIKAMREHAYSTALNNFNYSIYVENMRKYLSEI